MKIRARYGHVAKSKKRALGTTPIINKYMFFLGLEIGLLKFKGLKGFQDEYKPLITVSIL